MKLQNKLEYVANGSKEASSVIEARYKDLVITLAKNSRGRKILTNLFRS